MPRSRPSSQRQTGDTREQRPMLALRSMAPLSGSVISTRSRRPFPLGHCAGCKPAGRRLPPSLLPRRIVPAASELRAYPAPNVELRLSRGRWRRIRLQGDTVRSSLKTCYRTRDVATAARCAAGGISNPARLPAVGVPRVCRGAARKVPHVGAWIHEHKPSARRRIRSGLRNVLHHPRARGDEGERGELLRPSRLL